MASDDDDDYLSDKFLVEQPSTSAAKARTYRDLRKEAEKKAHEKQQRNRVKPRHERELEARQEGLSKSLFEREQEEKEMGISSGNKALSIMMKMGFTPGQSLGKQEEHDESDHSRDKAEESLSTEEPEPEPQFRPKKSAEPIALREWQGKEGIGKRKRAPSPSMADRMAKMAKLAEAASHKSFRDHARDEYMQRRAEGRLKPAQLTCITLDEENDKKFNALWLNPQEPESFPPGLMEAISLNHETLIVAGARNDLQARLRQQMKEDALQPLNKLDDPDRNKATAVETFTPDQIEESVHFLRLNAQDRLDLVLSYLRDRYLYCFWCGTRYEDEDDMDQHCPGEDEDSHD